MSEFYYPKSKRELIQVISQRYPLEVARFKKMNIRQLRAIRKAIIEYHNRSLENIKIIST